jgi:SEC10/PgrA surface exclusion-like protein/LPXTG-motif cell wall-anchored protein
MTKKHTLLTTTAAAAAAIATGAVATTAHADTTPATTSAVATQATAQQTTNAKIDQLNSQLQAQKASQSVADQSKLASGTAQINAAASAAIAKENASYQSKVASQTAANSAALASATIYTPAQKAGSTAQATRDYQAQQAQLDQSHQTNLNNLKSGYDAQTADVNNQIKNVQNQADQQNKDALANATTQVDGQINGASNAVNNAQAQIDTDQNAVNNAQSKFNEANTNLTNAQNALKNGEASQSSVSNRDNYPKITVTDKWNTDDGHLLFNVNMPDWTDTDPADNIPTERDSQGHLIGKSAEEAAVFAANVINHLRSQLGTPLVKVSQETIDRTLQAVQYDDDNNSSELEDQQNNAHLLSGLNTNWIMSVQDGTEYSTDSLAHLKENVYNAIKGWISEDHSTDGNGHCFALAGINGYGSENEYIGFNLTNKVAKRDRMLFIVPGVAVHDISLGNTSSSSVNLDTLRQAVTTAQSAYDSAKSALDSAKTKLANDTKALTSAKSTLATLKSGRDAAIQALVGNTSAASQIKALQNKLASIKSSYETNVKQENDSYAKQSQKLHNALNEKLAQISALPENTNALKAQLDAKLTDLKKAHEARLAKIQADAQAQIEALKAQLKAADDEANAPILAQIKALEATLAAKNSVSAAVKGNSNNYVAKNGAVVKLTSDVTSTASTAVKTASSSVSQTRAEYKQSLPQTGAANSLAAVLLGTFSAMFGLGLAVDKRKY